MTQRFAFLTQVLEKIGAPLLAAIGAAGTQKPAEGDPAMADAQRMAELIARSVQVSVGVGEAMNLTDSEEGADSVRLALTALASDIVAQHYQHHGTVPGDAELAKITKGFQTVLTFSDNFVASQDHVQRLGALGDNLQAFDEEQAMLCFLKAVTPVLSAVAEFPFGQNETTLIQNIVGKLTTEAQTMRDTLFGGGLEPSSARYYELVIVSALAQIYEQCHRGETEKLMKDDSSGANMDSVWEAFDRRAAMLMSVAGSSVPGGAASAAETVAPAPPAEPPPPPAEPPPAASAQPPAATPPAQPDNPMGFFKKSDEGVSAPPATETPPATPAPETPPAGPTEQPPPAAPPAERPPAGDPNTPPDNPMGFFKPGAKKDPDE